jgi:hypothetical protein
LANADVMPSRADIELAGLDRQAGPAPELFAPIDLSAGCAVAT